MAMSDLFGEMSFNLASVTNTIIILFMIFILFIFTIAIVAFFVVKKRKVAVNLFQERSSGGSYKFIPMSGKRKYRKNNVFLRLWRVGVIDKRIPDVDTDYLYQDKHGKDVLNLIMDKRGFIHKVKLPRLDDVIDFTISKQLMGELKEHKVGNPINVSADAVKSIFQRHDVLKKKYFEDNPEYDIDAIPNLHETVEQITSQIEEGKKLFGSFMEKHGGIVIFGGAMLFSVMLLIMAMVFSSKILG